MKYFKILDSIELKLNTNNFNRRQDRHKQIIVPAGEVLHPFNGKVIKHEAYIKTVTQTHRDRLLLLWDKVNNYAMFECKYDPN